MLNRPSLEPFPSQKGGRTRHSLLLLRKKGRLTVTVFVPSFSLPPFLHFHCSEEGGFLYGGGGRRRPKVRRRDEEREGRGCSVPHKRKKERRRGAKISDPFSFLSFPFLFLFLFFALSFLSCPVFCNLPFLPFPVSSSSLPFQRSRAGGEMANLYSNETCAI